MGRGLPPGAWRGRAVRRRSPSSARLRRYHGQLRHAHAAAVRHDVTAFPPRARPAGRGGAGREKGAGLCLALPIGHAPKAPRGGRGRSARPDWLRAATRRGARQGVWGPRSCLTPSPAPCRNGRNVHRPPRLRHRRPTLGSEHVHRAPPALPHHHRPAHGPGARAGAGPGTGGGGELQGWAGAARQQPGAAAVRQEALRLGLPPRQRREDEPHRQDVLPGAGGHGPHRLHAPVLPDSAGCGFLAVGEPILQRHRQLHQPQRRLPHLAGANRSGLRHGHWYGPGHRGGAQPLHQASPPFACPLGPVCSRGRRQLREHPDDEAAGDHQRGHGDGRGQQRAGTLQEGGGEGHRAGRGLQDRHGSSGHDYPAHHHGAAGEVPLHAAHPGSPRAAAGAALRRVPRLHGASCLRPVPAEMLPRAG